MTGHPSEQLFPNGCNFVTKVSLKTKRGEQVGLVVEHKTPQLFKASLA